MSVSINDPFERGVKGANTPVLDGAYASSTFKQDSRGTIGQGQIAVGQPDAGTPVADLNRDLSRTQVVKEDSRSGFTVYADEAAVREVIALAKGDQENSTILQGAEVLAKDPLKPAKDIVAEVKAWGSTDGKPGTRTDSQLEKLSDQLQSKTLPEGTDLAIRAARLRDDMTAVALANGERPEDVERAMDEAAAKGLFTTWAETQRVDAIEGERYRGSGTALASKVAEVMGAAQASPSDRTTSAPNGPDGTAPASSNEDGETIIVTGIRPGARPPSGLPSVVHTGLGKLGETYADASPITRRIIDGTLSVLSDGPVGFVAGEVFGGLAQRVAPDAAARLGGAINSVFVAGDSLLQSRTYGPVKGENDRGDNSNQTANAVTGGQLVVSALPVIGTIKKLEAASNPGTATAPIVQPVDLTDGRIGHITANHRAGAGKPGKTEFPASWGTDRIAHAVSDIASDPSLSRQFDTRGTPFVVGVRDGLEVRVNFYPENHPRAGQIATAYPVNVPANSPKR